jgi:hypothetical protein
MRRRFFDIASLRYRRRQVPNLFGCVFPLVKQHSLPACSPAVIACWLSTTSTTYRSFIFLNRLHECLTLADGRQALSFKSTCSNMARLVLCIRTGGSVARLSTSKQQERCRPDPRGWSGPVLGAVRKLAGVGLGHDQRSRRSGLQRVL